MVYKYAKYQVSDAGCKLEKIYVAMRKTFGELRPLVIPFYWQQHQVQDQIFIIRTLMCKCVNLVSIHEYKVHQMTLQT